MNDTNNIVVYRHRKPCGEVFYVGIGCEQRPYNTTPRNKFWANVVKKYPDYEVEVVATGLSWEMACELEELMILEYGRRDLGTGTLVNLTAGGDGSKGLIHSEETKQKIGAAHRGKVVTEETRQKMSAVHKGKVVTEKTKQKLSAASRGENNIRYGKPAVNRKLTFEQAQEIRSRYKTEKTSHQKLAQEYGISQATISKIINNQRYTITF